MPKPVTQLLLIMALLFTCPQLLSAGQNVIRLATTTSTDNSGLLSALLPPFEARFGSSVQVIAVGTGKALRMGRDGDVDVVLVHDRVAEQAFVEQGYGTNRRDVMFNDFVIVGPADDPAAISAMHDAIAALRKIADRHSLFVSRGDNSGTHRKELSLWQQAQRRPDGRWYREAGQGMGKVLQIAGELGAYTLTDRGTWLAYRERSLLKLAVEGDQRLFNPYGVIAVNPARHPDVNYFGAMQLIAWITSMPGQDIIRDFRIGGSELFHPMAGLAGK